MREHTRAGRDYGLVAVGRKAESYFRFRDYPIDAAFTGFSEQPTYEDARGGRGPRPGPVPTRARRDRPATSTRSS